MRTEATPGQWFCVWVAYGAAAPPSAGGGEAPGERRHRAFLCGEVQHQGHGGRILPGEQCLHSGGDRICGLLSGEGRQQDRRGQDVPGALIQFQPGGACGDRGSGEG